MKTEASYQLEEFYINFLIIGVGAQGCAAINEEPTKEILSDKKKARIHYVGVANDAAVLETCTVEQKICIPETALVFANELCVFWDTLPNADMVFIVTDGDNWVDIAISATIAEYLHEKAHCIMGMALLPKGYNQENYDAFMPLIASANATHIISYEEVYLSMVKIFQCIIDVSCVHGMIGIDWIDVCIIFGASGRFNEYRAYGIQAYMGYGIANGDKKSNRAKCAAQQALQNINLPAGKKLNDSYAALYSIRSCNEMTGDEVRIIGEIVSNALHEDTDIVFSVIFVDDVEHFEVQLIVVFLEGVNNYFATKK